MNNWLHNRINHHHIFIIVLNLRLLHTYPLRLWCENPAEAWTLDIEHWITLVHTADCSHEDYQLLLIEFHKISQKHNIIGTIFLCSFESQFYYNYFKCWLLSVTTIYKSIWIFSDSEIMRKTNNHFYFRKVTSWERNKSVWKSMWSKKKIFNRLFK